MPFTLARAAPERLFVGVDASAAGTRELSGRALRAHADNLLYVRAALEALPAELTGVADRVSVVLPWGSLLRAVAGPAPDGLRAIRALCQPAATLTVVLAIDPARDRSELARLGLDLPVDLDWRARLAEVYAAAGFELSAVRSLDRDGLAAWPSTWARRLAHGQPRPAVELRGLARGQPAVITGLDPRKVRPGEEAP